MKIIRKTWIVGIGLSMGLVGLLYIKRADAQRWFDMTAPIDQEMIDSVHEASPVQLNRYNESGFTGLMIAAAQGYADLARAFLDAGADPYLRQQFSYFGYTALHFAAYYAKLENQYQILQMLLDWGIPIYLRDQIEETVAHVIMYDVDDYNVRMKIMDYLIDQGIQINAHDAFGNTMLHFAVLNRDKEWIRLFREKYGNLINTTLKNSLGLTLLEYASYLGLDDEYDTVGAALRAEVPLMTGDQAYLMTDRMGKSALMCALYRGDIELAAQYIQQGATIDQQDPQGNTALHTAMSSLKPYAAVSLLVNSGAKVDVANKQDKTPFAYVVRVEDPVARAQIVKLLKSKGAQIPGIDPQTGISFLDLLRRQQDHSLVKLLE